jgi:hypothetical protein
MPFCTINPRSSRGKSQANSSLQSIPDCTAIARLSDLFLNALRFRVAVIFEGLHRTLTVSRGGLPNRAPAFAFLSFVCDGFVMSVPPGSPCRHEMHSHCAHQCVESLVTRDLRSPQRGRTATRFDVVKIDQTFFYTPFKLLAAESKVAVLSCDPCEVPTPDL